jgi:hypothetical protein
MAADRVPPLAYHPLYPEVKQALQSDQSVDEDPVFDEVTNSELLLGKVGLAGAADAKEKGAAGAASAAKPKAGGASSEERNELSGGRPQSKAERRCCGV